MSKPCNREACILRLERLAANAKLLAKELATRCWYDDAKRMANQLPEDANYVQQAIADDHGWEAGDR